MRVTDREIYISTPVYGTPALLHGLDLSTIKVLTDNAGFIFSVDDVIDRRGLTIYSTTCSVVSIFSELFADMDADLEVNEDSVYE